MTILIVEGTAKVFRKSGNIAVIDQEGKRDEIPLPDLELVVVVGERCLITSSAMLTFISQGVPLVVVSGKVDTYGVLFDVVQVGTVNVRSVQYRCFEDSYCRLKYARSIIISKLKGLHNVLKYEYKYHRAVPEEAYDQARHRMLEVLENVEKAKDVDELRVLEAEGSKYFWSTAAGFFPGKYGFTGRKPRKGDVINSAVDFLHAVLYGIVTKGIVVSGLDPFQGCIHTLKPGRISLTYDLSEIFKPIVAHVVVQASRKANLSTFKNSRLLKPDTIEVLMRQLHHRLTRESEKIFKRRSIWHLAITEANKLKEALVRQLEYKPFIYDPQD